MMVWFSWLSASADVSEMSAGVGSFDAVHTSVSPYCDDLTCWCHSSVVYHEMVTHPEPTPEDIEIGLSFFGVRCS